ncbi:MAG TPA: GNAT family N-acetyltransferase [Candidatus Limnocylindrales bacterium]|nr:GNAT family N-acetyltransferase [Candidatus Limnocylindrales bacterium]
MTSSPAGLRIRTCLADRDEGWASGLLGDGLAGRLQARRGEIVDVLDGEGLIAEADGRPVGLLTFRPDGPTTIELAALVVVEPGQGIGSALVEAFLDEARRRGVRRVWLVTTNDNLDALRLYHRRGFRLVALRAGAVDVARATIKPSIGEVASNGIPIRDELELAIDL